MSGMEGQFTNADVTLVLLAGGLGSRMGKRKDGVKVCGIGLVEWMLERVGWRGPTMLVGPADRSRVEGEEQVDRLVYDSVGGDGPLRGILTALMYCETPEMVVVPIDMPGLAARHIAWVVERGKEAKDASCVMLRKGAVETMEIEPFPSFFRKRFEIVGERRLNESRRSMRGLAAEAGVRVVDAPAEWDDWVWANLNNEADVARFERGIARLAAKGGKMV